MENQDYKSLTQSFLDNNQNISEDKAMELIVAATIQIREIKDEQKQDVKLTAAKEVVKVLNGGYKAAVNYEKEKINFLIDKLKEIQSGEINPTSSLNAK